MSTRWPAGVPGSAPASHTCGMRSRQVRGCECSSRPAGQPAARAGLARLLSWTEPGIEVIGEVATTEQALEACQTLRPDVVLVDLGLPTGDETGRRTSAGHGVARVLLGHDPHLAVVGLS